MHIFLLVSIALVLKGLRSEAGGERVPEVAYDFLLIASFVSARQLLIVRSFLRNSSSHRHPRFINCRVIILTFIMMQMIGIPGAFVWAVSRKKAMMEQALHEAAVTITDEQSAAARQRAIRLLQLGLTSNDDMRLLAQYFSKLDAMVN